VKDIQEFDLGIPFVLVGTQVDLRNDKKKQAELAQKGKAPIPYEKVHLPSKIMLLFIKGCPF
jgi:GTPase SAR1 family protein